MTHRREKEDMRVVGDETEKKRRERSRAERERERTQRSLYFHNKSLSGRRCQHVHCTIYHSINKRLVMLCCSDPVPGSKMTHVHTGLHTHTVRSRGNRKASPLIAAVLVSSSTSLIIGSAS